MLRSMLLGAVSCLVLGSPQAGRADDAEDKAVKFVKGIGGKVTRENEGACRLVEAYERGELVRVTAPRGPGRSRWQHGRRHRRRHGGRRHSRFGGGTWLARRACMKTCKQTDPPKPTRAVNVTHV